MASLLPSLARFAASAFLAGMLTGAHAGSLGVSPIRVHLSEGAPTAALTLENSGASAMVVQLQVMRWLAAEDGDRYEPAGEIVAMPPIMTIRPGEPQIVRLGLAGDVDPQRELAYRLYIEEVPPPPKDGYQGLQVALRVGVPVFVAPAVEPAPRLEWRIVRDEGGLVAHATNAGSAHQRVLKISVRQPGSERPFATVQAVADLLPGQSRQWRLSLEEPPREGRLRLSVDTDRGPIDVEVDPERR